MVTGKVVWPISSKSKSGGALARTGAAGRGVVAQELRSRAQKRAAKYFIKVFSMAVGPLVVLLALGRGGVENSAAAGVCVNADP